MLLLIISCILYQYFFNYNKKNIIIFTIIFTIIYLINLCYTVENVENVETFDIINVNKKYNENYNDNLFEYGSSYNKSFFRIKPINFVFNFISISYNSIMKNNIETFLYPYETVIGANITNSNNSNDITPYIELINNYGIIINSNNNDIKCNIFVVGISN